MDRALVAGAAIILAVTALLSTLPATELPSARTGQAAAPASLLVTPPDREPRTVSTTLTVSENRYEYVSGLETPVLTFNNSIPGPLLRVREGDTLNVTVRNTLDEAVTVHWHGVQLPNAMDGVPGVTQDPIQPGESMRYTFPASNPGTYWYHSHVDTKRHIEMGLQGPLVVTRNTTPFAYDQDQVLVLDDVLLNRSDADYMPFTWGRMHGRFGNVYLVNGQQNPDIPVRNNTVIRFRLINTANARTFTVSFNDRPMTVVANDIGLVDEPYRVHRLSLVPGQRYEVLVNLTDAAETESLYHVTRRGYRTLASFDVLPEAVSFTTRREAVGTFEDRPVLPVTSPDQYIALRGVRRIGEGLVWTINGKTHPDDPAVFQVEEGEYTVFQITNTQGQPHPMHLHGQKFQILRRNGQTVNDTGWRDTVMIGSRETIDIGFYPEETGDWVFHCHILEHADAGMLSIVRVT